ncbi:protein white-like isoform X2 [Ruditapes philippinarum]|uniref:protein white-like isoform X2 n=1 Tax=Ruditapes philippinarum TaxID=129788 RepID=UPI00295A8AD7|nr:protein white-like isoform X2 [Ruditapes philippinarum]
MLKSMMKKWQDSVICMTRRNVEEKADGVTLSWDNINVHVKPKRRICCRRQDSIDPPNQILKNVYGSIKPGTLLAIIGASGSGKTTLLNTLTTRVDTNSLSITGDIRVNGKVAGTNIRDISAYVRQDDMFIATMTVKEHLTFRALLRMDRTLSKDKRLARVQEVIHELGLQKCMNNMIGDPGRIKGISGGEMRRLSFASEILNDPPLLFCDEPTSGLDSFMAESIVQNLRSMTNKGKTVMCTIHQPSSEVFFLFNQILIMAEGRVAFLGGINDALNFFSSVGKPCPQNYNPCDFFIASMAVVPGNEAECRSNVKTICDEFEKTTNAIEMKNENHPKEINSSSRSSLLVSESSDRYGSPWYEQFAAVLTRSWKTTLREPMVMRVRLVQTISFPLETPIFKREYGIGLYRVDIYFISKTLAELPSYLIIPVIFSAIAYWMIGLYNTLEAFLVFTAVIVLVSNISVSFGYIVSAGTNSVTTALAIAPPTLIPLVMFGGFFLNSDSVPVYFIWLEYLSWFKYSNELLMVNQWDDVDMLSCDSNSTSPVDSCHFHNGKQVILYLNYSKDNLWFNIGLLLAMLIVYRIIAFILLLVKARSSKT